MGRTKTNFTPDEAVDMPVINEFAEAYDYEKPADIEKFLSEHGLQNRRYRCTIKQNPEDGGKPIFLPGSKWNAYFTVPEIGSKFGPGKYTLVFSWDMPGPNGNYKSTAKEVELVLGEQWADAHEEYMFQYSLRRKKRLEQLRHKAETEKILYGGDKKEDSGLNDLLGAKDKLMQLGVPVGGMAAMTGKSDSMMPYMLNMQQENTKLLVTMMNESQKNMMQLMGLMMQQNGGGNSFQQAMKETINMVTNVVDLKQALNPEKATLVDKIFEFMQGVAPQITQILAQPRQQAREDPMVKLAQNRPEVQAVKGDQTAIDALAQKLDAEYGIKQSNEILDVMQMQRSDALKEHLKNGGYDPDPHPPSDNGPEDASYKEKDDALPDSGDDLEDME